MNDTKSLLLAGLLLGLPSIASALTVEQLAAEFDTYKKQQAVELDKIRQENQSLRSENQTLKAEVEQTQQQIQTNTEAVDAVAENYDAVEKVTGWWDRTTIGGYGELHYNNRDIEGVGGKETVDFHRFVLFFGHEFTEKLRFFSELELEHSISGDDQNGEIELEQAYLEYDFTDYASAKAGLFLVPIGILNETHEPATFYGVERNEVEKYIIPTTWWEAGIAGNMHFNNGVSVDLALISGLNIGDDYYIRGGRGKVSKQKAFDPAIAGRVKYTGVAGLELASSIVHQTDLGQSDDLAEIGSGTLYETHVIYSHAIGPGSFTGKALFSLWDMSVNSEVDKEAEQQYGWYLEPSYRLPTSYGDVGVYGRYQGLSYYKSSLKEFDIWEAGANWWIHENVVLKANYIYKDRKNHSADESGFDLGIGYQF